MNAATKFVLFNLRILGLDPFFQNRTSKCLYILATSVCVLILWPYLIEIVFYFDGIELIEKCHRVVVPNQALGILYAFIWKRQILIDLVNANKQMWQAHLGPIIKNRITSMWRRQLIFVLTLYPAFICFLGITLAYYTNENELVFLGYRQCETPLCSKFQFLLQILMLFAVCMPINFTYFSLFWISISESVCHLEIFRYGIKNITPDNLRKNFKEFIVRHIEILRCISLIDSIFSSSLLVMFVMFPAYIIFGLFLLTREGIPPPMTTTLKLFPSVALCFLILFVFCAAGEVIKNKFESLCSAVYDIDWLHSEAKHNRLGRDMVLMLQMTQNCPELTINSLWPLNLNMYLQVLKFCYSVYTFLMAIQK